MNDRALRITLLGWWGAFPQPGEATSGVLVETQEGCLLLDCGSGVLSQYLLRSPVSRLKGVLLTHLHYDHMGDLGCLQYAVNHAVRVGEREGRLPVCAPRTPEKMWDAVQSPVTEAIPLTDGMKLELAGVRIGAKRVQHTVECYAYRLERGGRSFVYLTDTVYLPEAAGLVRGADLLLCEATVSVGTRHSTGLGHMTDLEAGRIAREGGAKRLCLFHLPSDGDLERMRRRAAQEYGKPVLTPDQQRVFLL